MDTLLRSRPVPLASFTAVMGLLGTGLDVRSAGALGYRTGIVGESVIAMGIGVYVILTVRWLLRMRSHPEEIAGESSRASSASFYGTIGVSLALTAAAIAPYSVSGARVLWFVSSLGGAALVLYLLGNWIQNGIDDAELNPAIFLPVVGNAASVYVAADIGVEPYAWFSFSLAFVCWVAFVPLVLYRLLVVKPQLPRRLAPQIAIFAASPAVLANAWFILDGRHVDDVFKVLACVSLFFALLAIRSWRLAWGEPFNVAMWGWTFPAAALAGAFEHIAIASPGSPAMTLAIPLLWGTIGVTSACAVGAAQGWVRRPEGHENPARSRSAASR